MSKKIEEFKGAWLFVLIASGIFFASSFQQVSLPDSGLSFTDKILHFFAYGALSTSLYRLPFFYSRSLKGALYALLFVSIFAVTDEFHQYFVGRNCDFFDWLADILGAFIAILSYARISLYRRLLEFNLSPHQKIQKITK